MDAKTENSLFDGMKAQQECEGPPEKFPVLPPIPGGRYTDPEFLALEKAQLWKNSWLYALHSDELPNPGSYRLWERIGSSIIILRDKNDKIHAFYNTCRHRGAPLIDTQEGEIKNFSCRYHGWTYGLNGDLIAVREKRDFPDLDMSCFGLAELRCEMFGNWIFINENLNAKPLLDSMGLIASHCDYLQAETIRHINSSSFEVACNMKIMLEAFLETYHLKVIHPKTADRFLDSHGTHIALWENGNSLMVTPHRRAEWKDPGTDGMPEFEDAPEIHKTQNASYNFFPNLIFPPSSTGVPFLTFWPKDDRTMIVDAHWFAAEGSKGHANWETRILNFNRILDEDIQLTPKIQKSIESNGFESMTVSYQERRIYYWHEELDRRIGLDKIPRHLRVKDILSDYIEDHC